MLLDRNSTKIDIRRSQDLFYIVVAHMQSMDDLRRMRGNWKTIVPHANCHPSILKRSHDRLPSRYFICNHSCRMPEGFVFNTATDMAWSLLSSWIQHCETRLCALNMAWCIILERKKENRGHESVPLTIVEWKLINLSTWLDISDRNQAAFVPSPGNPNN